MVIRRVICTGGSKRRHSSTALATRDGSWRRRSCWSGCSSRARVPLPMRLTVVSWPAMNSSTSWSSSSSSVRASPSSCWAIMPLRRSSPGFWRFHSMTVLRWARSDWDAWKARTYCSSSSVGSRVPARVCDQSRNSSVSSPSGRPSINEITWNGRGNARVEMSSKVSPGRMSARASSTRRCTCGRNRSMARGVNTRATSLRSRVWSGGSRLRIDRFSNSSTPCSSASFSKASDRKVGLVMLRSSTLMPGSRSRRKQSS